ncbi:hypothetical protein JXB12_10300 [candidate division KSB1 bacterium]|nr:hypothetical protein [candidate division KSB1 bacterium]
MATIHLPTDFKDFLKLLNSRKVKYLLVGGYAVGYHGYPRATADMDIWISTESLNVTNVINVINEFGFNDPELSASLFTKYKKMVRMGLPPIRIEVLSTIDGVEFSECYDSRIIDEIDGVMINIIDLNHLKKNKKASGRLIDLADLEKLP